MYTKVLFLIVTALLTISNPVMAGNREGAVTLSPFFGGQIFSKEAQHHDDDFMWGGRAGYNFTPHLGAELMFGQTSTVRDPEVIHCQLYKYGADILYHFRPDKNLVPFVAAGLGGFTEDYNFGIHDETHLYVNIGGGVEYSLNNWLALRSDLRYATVFNGGQRAYEVSGGLKFQFGGH
jgi:OOP family OmpA-OmpF porin